MDQRIPIQPTHQTTSGPETPPNEASSTVRLKRILTSIRHVVRLITTEKDSDRLLFQACDHLVRSGGLFNAWIARLDPSGRLLSVHGAGFEGKVQADFELMQGQMKAGFRPHCAARSQAGPGVQVIREPGKECDSCLLARGYQGRSGMSVALRHDDRVLGWLTLSTSTHYALDREEQELIQDVADDLALALHSLDIESHQRRRLEISMALGGLFTSLGTDTRRNIDQIVAQACELTGGAASIYNRLDSEGKSMLVWSGHRLPGDMPLRDAPQGHICYEATILGQDRTIAIDDLDVTDFKATDPNVARYGLKSYLGHPVRLGDRAIGSLAVVDGRQRHFDEEEVTTIRTLAWALSLEEERHAALARLAHMNQVLNAIRAVNHLIVHAEDADSLLSGACRLLVENRGLRNAWIVLVEDGQPVAPVYHAGEEMGLSYMADSLCVTGVPTFVRHLMRFGGVLRLSKLVGEFDDLPWAASAESGDYSALLLPIGHGREQYGWLTVSVPTEFADDPEEHGLLLEVAGDLGFSLHAMQVGRDEARHARLLARRQAAQTVLMDMSARLLQAPVEATDSTIEESLGTLARFAGADRAYVFRYSHEGTLMSNTHEWCAQGVSYQKANLQGLPVESFPWWMARLDLSEAIFVPRVEDLPYEAQAERTVLEAQDIRSLLALPLARGREFGFLGMDWVHRHTELDPDLVPLLQLAANLLQGAMVRLQTWHALWQREEEYRLLVENQNDLLVKVDREGHFKFVSPSYCRMFGKSEAELLGKRFIHLVHEADRAATLKAMRVLEHPPHTCQVEQRALTVRGWRWLDWWDTALVDDQGEITSIIGVGRDVTERKQAESKLARTLEDVIDLLGRVVEHRDPYTSGHQKRVAGLARAIAEKMGQPAETVVSVYMGGLIHDLGKIAVPAEILSKPGKLAAYEFTLIQQHPLTGYDIIRNLSFPWDIARMVLQHHEKLDGTGYPNGLKGDEILMEARILTVADVVEAMSTHRPYRAALGVEVALEEITRHAGQHYDPDVVAACRAVFEDGAFAFG